MNINRNPIRSKGLAKRWQHVSPVLSYACTGLVLWEMGNVKYDGEYSFDVVCQHWFKGTLRYQEIMTCLSQKHIKVTCILENPGNLIKTYSQGNNVSLLM